MTGPQDVDEIHTALQVLARALEDADPTAWVSHYTQDAVFDGGGVDSPAFVGRAALLDLARSMQPLRDVIITPMRTEVSGALAATWFEASWVTGPSQPSGEPTRLRGLIVMRREGDGVWRVAFERLG